MKITFCQINQVNRKFFSYILLLSCFILPIQTQATQNPDKEQILSIANWALINFNDIFFNNYNGPFTGFGYRYVCYDNNNCIGIRQDSDNVDVLIDGEILSVGTVDFILAQMANSQNGILNFSGDSVNDDTIPAIFSPGLGEVTEIGGTVISISWKVIASPGTNQQELCDFSVIINAANPNTVANGTLTRTLFAGGGLNQWTEFATDNNGLQGIIIDYDNRTLRITEDLSWPKISGGDDVLDIISGNILRF